MNNKSLTPDKNFSLFILGLIVIIFIIIGTKGFLLLGKTRQKMTPTTMDPAQAKVMAFMPVIFTFMMVSLPSGLTLYMFVSTLFGVVQQKAFMRGDKPMLTETRKAQA